jgi:hypothetical protein
MSTRQPNEQSMTKSPGAGDEKMTGVFRLDSAAACCTACGWSG